MIKRVFKYHASFVKRQSYIHLFEFQKNEKKKFEYACLSRAKYS